MFFSGDFFFSNRLKILSGIHLLLKKRVFLLLIFELLLFFGQILHEFPLNSQNVEGRLKFFTFIFCLETKI